MEVLAFFKQSLYVALEHLPAAFLLITAIQSCQEGTDYEFIIDRLLDLDKRSLKSKLLRRILVTVAKKCDSKLLSVISLSMNYKDNLTRHLDDKYATYLLAIMIDRDHT